jgi:chorismate mutase
VNDIYSQLAAARASAAAARVYALLGETQRARAELRAIDHDLLALLAERAITADAARLLHQHGDQPEAVVCAVRQWRIAARWAEHLACGPTDHVPADWTTPDREEGRAP